MRVLKVDPEFQNKIPALTQDEFKMLEENILADGEVREPLVVWGDTIVDGHNRWKVIQKHPHIPYKIKQMDFPDRWAAIAWMCRNQLGQHNLNEVQRMEVTANLYEAQKRTVSNEKGINQYTKAVDLQSEGQPKRSRGTAEEVAKQSGVSTVYVERAVRFSRGLNAADEISPGFKASVISGELKAPKSVISSIRNMSEEEKKETVTAIKEGRVVNPPKKSIPTNTGLMDSIVAGLKRQDATTTDDEFSDDFVKILEAGVTQARNWMTNKYPRCNASQNKKIIAALEAAEQAINEMKGMVTNET